MNNMQKIKFVLLAPCYKRCLAARSDAGIKVAFLRIYTVICNDIMKENSFWTVFHQLFPVSTGFTEYLFVLIHTCKLVFHFFILNVCRGLNGTLRIQSLSEMICGCGMFGESVFPHLSASYISGKNCFLFHCFPVDLHVRSAWMSQ